MDNYERDIVFLSHANPEDNEFTLWLALQLTNHGYTVWSDLTELLGGEVFWNDIEDAIRNYTVKFLFVLSKDSNRKQGPLDELKVAKDTEKNINQSDFIIPLHIDDLPYSETNIQISSRNIIPFENGWELGFKQLLKKLSQSNIPNNIESGPSIVAKWWKTKFEEDLSVEQREEIYSSNQYEITSQPKHIFFHSIDKRDIKPLLNFKTLEYPIFQYKNYLISFAEANFIHSHTRINNLIHESTEIELDSLYRGKFQTLIDPEIAKNYIKRIYRIAWEEFLSNKGLKSYSLSSNKYSYFFPYDIKNHQIPISGLIKKTKRSLSGYSETKDRYWHFGIQSLVNLDPYRTIALKHNILFSDDGKTIWSSKPKLHNARRSYCRYWYNRKWGEMQMAAMKFISNGNEFIEIPLGKNHQIKITTNPLEFKSPVFYEDEEIEPEELYFQNDWGNEEE